MEPTPRSQASVSWRGGFAGLCRNVGGGGGGLGPKVLHMKKKIVLGRGGVGMTPE